MAFSTGVEPAFAMRSNMVMVSGDSDPTRNRVVLKFSNDTRNATMPATIRAGRRNGRVTVASTRRRLAPRLKAASPSAGPHFLSRAGSTSAVTVVVKSGGASGWEGGGKMV